MRLIPRCETLPSSPPPGCYVVVDVLHFSNTVIELLHEGAASVRVDRFDDVCGSDVLVGAEPTATYEPPPDADFFNSPSAVANTDVAGREAVFWSANGGRTVSRLQERGGPAIEVYVGSTLNARAVAKCLRDEPGPVWLVAAGSRGEIALEDLLGAWLIRHYIDGPAPKSAELDAVRKRVKTAKGEDYIERHPVRRRDVLNYAINIDGRDVVPRLVDGVLLAE